MQYRHRAPAGNVATLHDANPKIPLGRGRKTARATRRRRASAVIAGLLAAFLCLVSSGPSSAQQEPVNKLLSLMIVSDMLLERCPDAYRPRYSDEEQARFRANFAELEGMLADLAMRLDPALERETAENDVTATIDRRRGKFASNLDALGCSAENISAYVDLFDAYAATDFRARFEGDVFPDLAFDQRHPIKASSTGASTYAYEAMQEIAILIIATNDELDRLCPDLDVLSVSLELRRELEAANWPLFVAGPISYEETWRVQCDGEVKDHLVIFSQTSNGGFGKYFVR